MDYWREESKTTYSEEQDEFEETIADEAPQETHHNRRGQHRNVDPLRGIA